MVISLIIALVLGGGTAFAAESSLPGDVLYPIKVSVNEEFRSFVSFSDESKARWDSRRAERRLEEAEQLAAEGRFNANARTQIESHFYSHADAFHQRTEIVGANQNARGLLELHSNFEASLTAHDQILTKIAAKQEGVRGEINSLLVGVRAQLNATSKARSNAVAIISVDGNGKTMTAAEGKLRAAENKIGEVGGFIARLKSSVSANTYTQAELKLTTATEVVARGKAEMEAELYGKAFASFQEAIRIAQEVQLLAATENKIDLDLAELNVGVNNENDIDQESNIRNVKHDTSSDTVVESESDARVESESDSSGIKSEGQIKIDIGL